MKAVVKEGFWKTEVVIELPFGSIHQTRRWFSKETTVDLPDEKLVETGQKIVQYMKDWRENLSEEDLEQFHEAIEAIINSIVDKDPEAIFSIKTKH